MFWRTFFLIAGLIAASLIFWYESFRTLERSPRAEQAAQMVASIVNLTRSALIHSDPEKRRSLLIDLAQNEGLRIYSMDPGDQIEPLPDDIFLRMIERQVKSELGPDTRLSLRVNGQEGLWVSFFIDEDGYWVVFDPARLETIPRLQWLNWGLAAVALSLVGAVVISRLINQPLKRLAGAAVALGQGRTPEVLPDRGPREIREANTTFNSMVRELQRIEADRTLLLAGISHDLRTPLTRLRLEIELNALDDATRAAMSADVDQMDAIIGQFLDYARPAGPEEGLEDVDLSALVAATVETVPQGEELLIKTAITPGLVVRGHPTELKRVLLNLLENARRYGQPAEGGPAQVEVSVSDPAHPTLEVADHGPGVPEEALERLKRPFTRMDTARSQASGAGLGLAIIERIAQRHGASFILANRRGGGLSARFVFKSAARA